MGGGVGKQSREARAAGHVENKILFRAVDNVLQPPTHTKARRYTQQPAALRRARRTNVPAPLQVIERVCEHFESLLLEGAHVPHADDPFLKV